LPDRITGRPFATRSEVLARNGMAATSQPLATQTAIDVLKKGGGAVDAAIAANAVLGLVEPTGCGIGGDLFAIVWSAGERKLHGLNASGRSPRDLTLKRLRELAVPKIPSFGPLSLSVPGAVDGWFELGAKLGKLPMKELLEPAISYALEGFPVSEIIAEAWAANARGLSAFPGFAETYLVDGGRPPRKGEVFRNPNLAATLRKIAEGGRDEFYCGAIAERIESFVRGAGGFLTRHDMAEHRSEWVAPVSAGYRGFDVWELPPNGQGIAALQILNLLEGFDLRGMGFGTAAHLHHFVESKKLAFEDRAKFYADPEFARAPVAELISKDYATRRRRLISSDKAALEQEPGDPLRPLLQAGDTVYLTTADRDGNMVSLIQSNFRGMGSGLCPLGLGFGLQNRGELFSLEEGHANVYAPAKRPFHTIIPAFITRAGKPFLSFGVMGGDTQPQMHAQIVTNLLDFGMNLQEAGDAPRMLHSGSSDPTGGRMRDGGEVHLESGFPDETARDLLRLGHRLTPAPGAFGGYQAIGVDTTSGVYYGASESRKDGQAAGY
jgi:gamma-glutamyltranspeptidase/glutathione hydrolase